MLDIIKKLSLTDGTSGHEKAVRDYIISIISSHCESYHVDALGNLIVFKKGAKTPKNKVMFDSHMDEVGIIETYITDDGMLKFGNVGGIDTKVILGRRFKFENGATGVAGIKPIHLAGDEKDKIPDSDSLYIDIGASSKEEASEKVHIGETGVFVSDFVEFGDNKIKGKALDDRVGCAVLIDIILGEIPYDAYFSFSVQEEIGLRGAGAAAYSVDPDYAVVLETTTAADIIDVPDHKKVCILGKGATVSFMDRSTIYSKELFDTAFRIAGEKGIKIQPKTMVAGGNNAGAIHKTAAGIKTITINTPCRYLHSPSCVCDTEDIKNVRLLSEALLSEFADA